MRALDSMVNDYSSVSLIPEISGNENTETNHENEKKKSSFAEGVHKVPRAEEGALGVVIEEQDPRRLKRASKGSSLSR